MALLSSLVVAAGCRQADPHDEEGRRVLRVGFMPNLTHAPALLGLEQGIFSELLGPTVVLEHKIFIAGPSVIEALFAGELDVAYVGPNPALNAYMISEGKALRIVSGCTSGGAQLMVREGIERPEDLMGQRVATPALANTQDIALRTWLREAGLEVGRGEFEVEVVPIAPSDSLRLFAQGELAGAWVPEPWASRLAIEEEAHVMVDERDLWPGGRFPTTVIVASAAALEHRPDLVRKFLVAHGEAIRALKESPERSRALVARRLQEETGFALEAKVLNRAYTTLDFTLDPMKDALLVLAERALRLGYLKDSDGIERAVDTSYLP